MSIYRNYLPLLLLSVLLLGYAGRSEGRESVKEIERGSAERTAFMNALRGPVSKYVGKPVTFTGSAKISGAWATFSGDAAPTDKVTPKDEGVAMDLELDLFALLQKKEGKWKVLYWAFAGDVGPLQEARDKFPEVPEALVPVIP